MKKLHPRGGCHCHRQVAIAATLTFTPVHAGTAKACHDLADSPNMWVVQCTWGAHGLQQTKCTNFTGYMANYECRTEWRSANGMQSDTVYHKGTIIPANYKAFFRDWMPPADTCVQKNGTPCQSIK